MAGIKRQYRNLPFLNRNWVTAINSWQGMGGKASSPAGNPADTFVYQDDDGDSRPAKRRRIADASPDSSALGRDYNGYCLPEQPGHRQRALRIEVLKIIHKGSARVKFNTIFNGIIPPAVKDVETARARCKITIYCDKGGLPRLLHCDSQICDIKSFKNPVGPSRMTRVYLPRPFAIPEEKIFVEVEDDSVFDMADAYTVLVELESAGDYANWPPLEQELPQAGNGVFLPRQVDRRHWVLSATLPNLFERSRPKIPLHLKKGSQADIPTDFVVEVDVKWTTGFSDRMVAKSPEKGVLPSIVAIDQDESSLLSTNGSNGHVNGHVNGYMSNGHAAQEQAHGLNGIVDDEDDEGEGELTPNRSLRTRGNKTNYNLKDLSDKAQGKERRRRRKMEKWNRSDEEFRLTYNLPAEQLALEGFVCCVCGAPSQSMNQLRVHFYSHPQYIFDFESRPGRGGNAVTITHKRGAPGLPLRPQVYQLGRATKPLDLDRFLEGDESWITSRYGPDNDIAAQQPVARVPQKLGGRRKDTRLVVPNTKHPLFDPLSKIQLEPGSEVRRIQADDRWLIHKHREIVQDYSDVDSTEKEFIKEWDSFIIGKRLSSMAYLPRTLVAFAKERAAWLVDAPSRSEEFGKHLAVLLARGVLDDNSINEALARVAEARNQHKEGLVAPKPTLSPKEAAYRSRGGCAICQLPVLGPSLLVCGKRDCPRRLHHDECVRASTKMPIDHNWRCNRCVGEESREPGHVGENE